jgi:hypothetical protein
MDHNDNSERRKKLIGQVVRRWSSIIVVLTIIVYLMAPWYWMRNQHPDGAAWIQLVIMPTTVLTVLLGIGLLFWPFRIALAFLVLLFVVDVMIASGVGSR